MPDPVVEPHDHARDYPDVSIIGDLVPAWRDRDPRATWISPVGERPWRREDLAREVARIQRALTARGIDRGDSVALMCANSAEMVATLLAVVGLGAVAVPINTALASGGLEHVLDHSDARMLVADPVYIPLCGELAPRLAGDRTISTRESVAGTVAWVDAATPEDAMPVSVGDPADPALNIYTSGTTGTAKGVVLSHTACLTSGRQSAAVMFEATADDVIYTCLPFFHCAALQLGLFTSLISGAELILEPSFSASTFWSTIHTHRVTAFHFIGPLMSIMWLAPPSPEDRSHDVRLAVGGGPRSVWTEFEERFGIDIVENYGMTETFGGCVSHRPRRGKPWTVGRAMSHIEVQVVDKAGRPLGPEERGEILIRPRAPDVLFSGYYREPHQTEEAWQDGWYRTGDLGSRDRDGFLRFHSRLRDIIRHRGENISAVEVETVLAGHPAVAECAVIGIPSELYEEELLAVVVPAGGDLDPVAILRYASEHLPRFAVPRFVAAAAELPKTATARVQKHLLKDLWSTAFDRQDLDGPDAVSADGDPPA